MLALEFRHSQSPSRTAAVRKEITALLVLVLLLLAFFSPLILKKYGIFHDDLAMDEFPRLYSYARNLRQGIIPLWRPETWCGARPFYSDYYSNFYYLPFWPFFLLAPLDNLDAAYLWLYLLPLLVHYALAALGTYLLTRRGFGLAPPAAVVSSLLYTFSPGLMFSYVWSGALTLQVWLPWLLLIYLLQIKSPSLPGLFAGGVLIALMATSASVPHLGYVVILMVLVGIGLMIGKITGFFPYACWRPPAILAVFLAFGFLLTAVYWLPALSGIETIRRSGLVTYSFAAGGEGSLHPLYLSSLLLPGLFGGLNGTHLWGLGHIRFWEANMVGGLAVTLLVLLGIILPWTLSKEDKRVRILRLLAATGGMIYLCSLLLMLGRHTPFYRVFWHWVPLAGQFPYPIRYRLLQCAAAAVLGGLGTHVLFDSRLAVRPKFWRRVVRLYLIVTLLIVAGVLFWPPPKIIELLARGDFPWFITSPLLHLVLGIGLIAWRASRSSSRGFAVFLALFAILEIGYTAFHAFYLGTFQMGGEIYPQHLRARGPSSHPMYRRALVELAPCLGNTKLRVASDQPFHDNLQQCGPYFSLMGYDMKPLEERFRRAIETAYKNELEWNYLYGLHDNYHRAQHPAFYSNMSVGFFLSALPENPFPGGTTVEIGEDSDYYLHLNPNALPRGFLLDRIVSCSEEEAMRELVEGDLRRGVFVDDRNQLTVISNQSMWGSGDADHRLSITDYQSFDPGEEDAYLLHFEELQEANPITRLDFSNPNRVEVELTVTKPALLVLTEVWYPGWDARVDGAPVPFHRVNYLQRGVQLEEGDHRIELVFQPRVWKIGGVISIVSWTILLLIVLGAAGNKLLAGRSRIARRSKP